MKNQRIAVLIGSLRQESWNKKIAQALMAQSSLDLEIIEIGQLPFYNEDLENTPPAEWVAFRDQLQTFNGFLFVTPEYNRSVPAVLKNALDVGSRPYGKSVWDGKPGAVVTASPGGIGGFGANHHLRQSLVYLNVPTMQQPEAYIGGVADLFGADGKLNNESTQAFLKTFMEAFASWVTAHVKSQV